MKFRFVVAGVTIALLLMACNREQAGISPPDGISKLGYIPVFPPDPTYGPGAVVALYKEKIERICSVGGSIGTEIKADDNKTADMSFVSSYAAKFNANAGLTEIAKKSAESDQSLSAEAKAALGAIKSVTFSITNARTVSLAGDQIDDGIRKYRTEGCRQSIEKSEARRIWITMVTQGIIGDMTYHFEFKNEAGINASAKLEAIKAIAGALQLESESATSTAVMGKGLLLGIRHQESLAK